MKEELDKAVKTLTITDAVLTGLVIIFAVIALLARAIYLAWK
jgi:hypothetical protein